MVNVDSSSEVAPDREGLGEPELEALETYFERGLEDTRGEDTETVRRKLREYYNEIKVGAEIARAQFDQRFGGMQPEPGKFAISRPIAGYFGFDSWEGQMTSMTAGADDTWINDGAPDNLGGTDTSFGNPLQIGDQAVHVLCGVGTYSPSPKIESVEYEINEEPRTAIRTKWEWTKTDLGIKWFDRPILLVESTLFEAQCFPGVAGDDAPYFVGVSFIESRASQESDPANMATDSVGAADRIVGQG